MRPSAFSTLLFFTAAAAVGYALLPLLPLKWLPTGGGAALYVRYDWPEASPEALERSVTAPLEGAFSLLSGVKKVGSVSGRGSGHISLEIEKGADAAMLRFEVAGAIRRLYPRLPQGASYPQVTLFDPKEDKKEQPLLVYTLSGSDAPPVLYRYANEALVPQLAGASGSIGRIEVAGGNGMEWVVRYDEGQMAALGLGRQDLLLALAGQYRTEALGFGQVGQLALPVVLKGSDTPHLRSKEEGNEAGQLLATPVVKRGSRTLRLGDVATASQQEQRPSSYYRINGQNSLRLMLYPEQSANQLEAAKQWRRSVAKISSNLPKGYQISLEHDGSERLQSELDKILHRTALSLLILLAFSALAYRSWRYMALITASLAVNLGLAFICYYFFQVELHTYALAGATLSFGMVVDNAIIMAHHLSTHPGRRAAGGVFPAMVACTLTTIAALAGVFFLPEAMQFQLADFAKVIIVNLGVSLAVAYWFIPAMMEKTGLEGQAKRRPVKRLQRLSVLYGGYAAMLGFLLRWRKTAVLAMLLLFGLPVFMLPSKVEGWDWYNRTLGSDYYREDIKPHVDKWLGGTLRLFSHYVWEGGGFRQPQETVLYAEAALPFGGTAAQLNDVLRQMEQYLARQGSGVRRFTTDVASGQHGVVTVFFDKNCDPAFPYILRSRLVSFSLDYGGVKWNVYGVGQGFSNEGGSTPPRFQVMLRGYRSEQLAVLAERLAERLRTNPRAQKIDTEANINWWERDLYELEMHPDALVMVGRGVSNASLSTMLQEFNLALSADFYTPKNMAVRLENSRAAQLDRWALEHETQRLDSLRLSIPELASIDKRKVATSIHKEDQQYLHKLDFEYTGSGRFGQQHLDTCLAQLRLETPPGYWVDEVESSWGKKDKRKQYWILLLVALMVFFICSILFNSLRQGFANLLLIPTSFIGIFLTFYWGGFYFDQGGYAAFLLVSGTVVNSLILLANDYNYFQKKQPNNQHISHYIKAFRQKILPIWLTVISTVVGMVPFMVLGDKEVFWFSLSVGSAGGLLFSLIVITVFIPIIMLAKAQRPIVLQQRQNT
jgi:multidrug efflux pump subunit AcrB